MAHTLSRVKREQLRKRRNNLLRRHNEFWLLYGIKSWLVMEMPDGQILSYHSHPDIPPPSKEDIVWLNRAGSESVGTRLIKGQTLQIRCH
jgi:hypothetical protein